MAQRVRPRSVRRALEGRDFQPRYNGPRPVYVPARLDECEQHHRKLPCKRCTPQEQS